MDAESRGEASQSRGYHSLRRFFFYMNKLFMVPLFRLGFGPLMGNPLTGYIMVLKTRRKSGRILFVPVNYAINGGSVYCISGWGKASHWYRNIKRESAIEVMLPTGCLAGTAEEVGDPDERFGMARRIFKNAGFAGFFEGFNPNTVSEDLLRQKLSETPVIRIRPTGMGSGAGDPGGWMWVVGLLLILALIMIL